MQTKLFGLITLAATLALGVYIGRHWLQPRPTSKLVSEDPVRTGGPVAGAARVPARVNPARAAAVLNSDGAGERHTPPSSDDVETALRAVVQERRSQRRVEVLTELTRSLSISDLPRAVAAAEKILPDPYKWNFISQLVARWAESDPAAAVAYAQSIPGVQVRNQAIRASRPEGGRGVCPIPAARLCPQ